MALVELLSVCLTLALSALMLLGIEAALALLGRARRRAAPFDPRPPGRRAAPSFRPA